MNFESEDKTVHTVEVSNSEAIIQPDHTIEKPKVLEVPDNPEAMAEYQTRNSEVQEQIEETQKDKEELKDEIQKVRNNLGLSGAEDAPSVDALNLKLEALTIKQIEASSNYPGNWTLLLRDRMLDPISKEKFAQTRQESMIEMKTGEIGMLDKPKQFANHYQNQIDNYDERVKHVFDSTGYITAQEAQAGKTAINLGMGNIDMPGMVYVDAVHKNGEELTPRQKNIIEAHEKGHGLRDFHSPIDQTDFGSSIDRDIIYTLEGEAREQNPDAHFANYMLEATEIAERMAQLKNYFGFKADDAFTKQHLEYAKQHYVKDTALDNNMTTFFKAITERTTDKFIETINKYPL